MGAFDSYEDDDEYGTEPSGSDLLKQLRKQVRELSGQVKNLNEENTSLKASTRSASLKDILASKNANPKLAAFMQDVEPTPEAVTKWLADYQDVFNATGTASNAGQEQDAQTQGTPQSQPVQQQGFAPPADDAVIRAFQAAQLGISRAQEGSTTTQTPSASAEQALFAAAGDSKTADQFFQTLRNSR